MNNFKNIVFTSPGSDHSSRKLLLLGSGELGKELLLEAHRWGFETYAVSRYEGAPATHVAHHSYVIDMTNAQELRKLVQDVQPTHIVPEIEALHIETLVALENEGFNVVPSAKAVYYTMNRERIRRLASEKYKIMTSNYKFAETYDEFVEFVKDIGFPSIVKPVMSSSGQGQSTLMCEEDIEIAWNKAHTECRGGCDKVIIEKMVDFDYELTLMTLRHKDGVDFCKPIIHKQKNGDFAQSIQSFSFLTQRVEEECMKIAKLMVDDLGGYGIFGVEFFIKGSNIYFNEMSPRPHDTAMLTSYTQNMSQFELHLRAFMNIPVPKIVLHSSGISVPLIVRNSGDENELNMSDVIVLPEELFKIKNLSIHIFGKPVAIKRRRMGLLVYTGPTIGILLNAFEGQIKRMIENYLP